MTTRGQEAGWEMPPYIHQVMQPVIDPTAQTAICTVLVLIVLDVLVGLVGAVATGTFSSEKMRAGLLHKFMEMSCIVLGVILDAALMGGVDFIVPEPVLVTTCGYIGVMEVGSLLELFKKYNPELLGPLSFLTEFVQPKGGE